MGDSFISSSSQRSSIDMNVMFNSFERCNEYISEGDDIDLLQYLNIIQSIPYDYEANRHNPPIEQSQWLNCIIEHTILIAHLDARAFSVSVATLNQMGFNVDECTSKTPKWILSLAGRVDNQLSKELRFLKRNKLIENIDFISSTVEVGGEIIITGYKITRPALYRLISNKYGVRFLEALVERLGKIIFFFNEFKKQHRSKHLDSLQKTIIGLNDDVKTLNEKIQYIKQSTTNNDNIPNIFTLDDPVFGSENSFESQISNISSNEIMDRKDYSDELYMIHKTITGFINTVDDRFSIVHHSLLTVVSKIDDLVGSIVSVNAENKSPKPEKSSSQRVERSSLRETCHSNPVLDHVQYIFNEYEKIGLTPPVSPTISTQIRSRADRHTCIGSGYNL